MTAHPPHAAIGGRVQAGGRRKPAGCARTVRGLLVLATVALAGCTGATASRLDDRSFRIEGPGLPVESQAPNRHIAMRLCPQGYRVVDHLVRYGTPDGIRDELGLAFTNWTIRCI